MSKLTNAYAQAMYDEIFRRYLHKNIVPSVADVTREFDSLMASYPALTSEPLVKTLHTQFDKYEHMRADKYNQFWRRVYKDLLILFTSTVSTLKGINTASQNWDMFYNKMLPSLDTIEDRADELLLLKNDTLGYFYYVRDDFSTLAQIDSINTTAEVDTNRGICILPQQQDSANREPTRVNIDSTSVRVIYTVKHPDLLSSSLGQGVSNSYILKDNNKPWYVVATTSQPNPAINCDIIVDLGQEYMFNNITAHPYHSASRSPIIVTAFYSLDGRDWIKAGGAPVQSLSSTGSWSLHSVITARYVRFLLAKNDVDQIVDNGDRIWILGFNSIELFQDAFLPVGVDSVSSILQTSLISIEDKDGNPKSFNKVSLQACEILLPSTDIIYEVSTDGANFLSIGNLDRTEDGVPPIVDFGDEQYIYSLFQLQAPDESVPAKGLSFDFATLGIAADFTNSDGIINMSIPTAAYNNMIGDSLVLWRNVGTKGSNLTVRDNLRGWHFDNDRAAVSTNILILAPDGINIDIGSNGFMLDGTSVKGSIILTEGTHNIVTNIQNWRDVVSGSANDDELRTADALYPYNHKLLIEGYQYNDSTYNGLYKGVDIFAEYQLTYFPIYSYNVVDTDDPTVYTTTLGASELLFITKIDASYSDYANERFEMFYKVRDQAYTSILLRATLTSTDTSRSPILRDFTLKVG